MDQRADRSMHMAARLVSFLSRRTGWAEGHVFAFAPEQFAASDGLRTAFAVATFLVAEIYVDDPTLAFGAIAAFWTSLCDPLGANRHRARVMATFALMGAVVISLSAYGAYWGSWAGSTTLFALTFLCLLTRTFSASFGPMPAQGGFIAAIAVVVGLASPRSMPGAVEIGLCFMAGSFWMILLAILPLEARRASAGRLAAIAVLSRLDEMAAALAALDRRPDLDPEQWSNFDTSYRRAMRFSIERGREAVKRAAGSGANYIHVMDAAGRIFSALVALGHQRRSTAVPLDPSTDVVILHKLRKALQQTMQEIDSGKPDGQVITAAATSVLELGSERNDRFAKTILHAAQALATLGRQWDERIAVTLAIPTSNTPAGISSAVLWHSLRTAIAVLGSYLIGVWLGLALPYWGAIATLVVMQPLAGNTWLRVIERAIGSIFGGVIAAVAIAWATTHLQMAVLIVPLCAIVVALRLVNYGLFVVFLTPMFMLMTDYVHPVGDLIWERIVNEARGACIGIAAGILLWPTRERHNVAGAVAAAIAANMAFASAVLRSGNPSDSLDLMERDAGLASSRLETDYERLWLEGRGRSTSLARLRVVIIALRSICGAAAATELAGTRAPDVEDKARADAYQSISDKLQSRVRSANSTYFTEPARLDDDDLEHAVESLISAVLAFTGQHTR